MNNIIDYTSIDILDSGKYEEASSLHKVFNYRCLNEELLVKLPEVILPRKFQLSSIFQVSPVIKELDSIHVESCKQTNTWLIIPWNILDRSVGYHIYKIVFRNLYMPTFDCDVYFSYTIQNDDPEKPYIYMKRDEEEA